MRVLETRLQKHLDLLIQRYPALAVVKQSIQDAYFILQDCYEHGGKLLVAGNGGSAADSEHIAGELMKRFRIRRPVSEEYAKKLTAIDPVRGPVLARNLERSLMAIPLVAHEALTTAYINDVDGLGVFAQQLMGFGRSGDVFLGISTSGNSRNVLNATVVARASDIKVIGLTGASGGELAKVSDVAIRVPETETYRIQELHLPVYHCLCLMLEDHFSEADMLTVITAGGKGSRIQALAPAIPKPMIPIDGVPVLEREIIGLREQGFTEFLLTVSHLGSVIMEHFGNGEKLGVHIRYYNEEHPLGTAGALFQLRDQLTEPFLLLNADAVFDVDFNRFVAFHTSHGGLVTLFTHPNDHPADSGLIVADDNNTVTEWLTKEDKRPLYYKNRVNAGLHVIDPALLDLALAQGIGGGRQDGFPVDLDRQLLKPLAGSGRMFCYDSPEYVKDMGTPERYQQVTADFAAGRVQARNLSRKQKAVFLDRDGTINRYKGFLRDISEFELIPGVAAAIRQINASGYLAIVVTNQPVVSRGEVTPEQLREIHNKMETELGQAGAYLDRIYFCPHHPHKGYAGEIPALKFDCACRKPKPGMLLQAAKDSNIDLAQSFMLGDSENDIRAGNAAGCRSILLNGYGTAGTTGAFGQVDTMDSVATFVKQYLCAGS